MIIYREALKLNDLLMIIGGIYTFETVRIFLSVCTFFELMDCVFGSAIVHLFTYDSKGVRGNEKRRYHKEPPTPKGE